MRTIVMWIMMLACLSALGCSRSSTAVAVHPVNGKVLYGGKPAEGVRVYFFPIDAPTVPQIPANPRGVTDRDGRFALTTYAESDGAPEGEYLVILLWPAKSDPPAESEPDQLRGWYDAAHTKLNARVSEGENKIPAFELPEVSAPPPASEGIPGRN